jgi:hypothetical protein
MAFVGGLEIECLGMEGAAGPLSHGLVLFVSRVTGTSFRWSMQKVSG